MQRVKRKENKLNKQKIHYNTLYAINNNSPNGTTKKFIKQTTSIHKDIIPNQNNKFLSVPERQKIIHEINQAKKQLNLYHPPENQETIQIEEKNTIIDKNKKLLYIKKTKSNLNLSNKPKIESKFKKINRSIGQNYVKFVTNKNLINKTIKEYYKNENPFKTYLKNLNNDVNDNKIKNCQKSQYVKNLSNNKSIIVFYRRQKI